MCVGILSGLVLLQQSRRHRFSPDPGPRQRKEMGGFPEHGDHWEFRYLSAISGPLQDSTRTIFRNTRGHPRKKDSTDHFQTYAQCLNL